MSWEVEIVDDVPKASSRYQQPPRNEQPSQRTSREPADGWDVEILDDKRTVPPRDRPLAQPLPSRQPRPPKLPSVKSQVLSHLRDADQPNITVRELTDAGIPVDFRVIEELVGEGWLMYMGGQRRGIDTVWRYIGEWLIRPEVQSTMRRSQTVDARKIWGRVKNKEGFEQVGKEVVKEVLFRIMEGHAEWRGVGRGAWRRVEERG